jgi:Cd2+/Zn2+-exporting ATPase
MEECCSTKPEKEHNHNHEGHDHSHSHDTGDQSVFQMFLPAIISFLLLLVGIALDHYIKPGWFTGWIAWFGISLPTFRWDCLF